MAPMQQSQLSESVIIHSNVPFPILDVDASLATGTSVLAKDEKDTVNIEYVSELVTASVQTSLFRTRKGDTSSLDLVHDANGRPVIFSIGSDGHLYCIFHLEKAARPWQLLDITPSVAMADSPLVVTAFDVLEVKQDLHFGVSLRYTPSGSSAEVHEVLWASIKQPSAEVNAEGQVVGLSTSDFKWTAIKNNLGSRVITKLACVVNPDAQPGIVPFTIFAATRTTDTHFASAYALDPNPLCDYPWTIIAFGAQSLSIVDIQPLVVGGAARDARKRAGLVVLSEAARAEGNVVGEVSTISVSPNSWGFQNLNDPCLDKNGQIIMPNTAFTQVTCKETMLANPRRYLLSILAVSDTDELYLIEGERDAANFGIPTFRCSGLPIRTDVAQIGCHYNKQLNAMEFIYTTKQNNQICHLSRDPQTAVWTATDLQVQGPGTVTKERQYLTTVTFTSKATGNPVPVGYSVSLKSEPKFVKINDFSYRLNRARPTVVTTNASGQIDIATEAPDQLGVSAVEVSLSTFSEQPFVFSIDLCARVTAMMSSIRSKDDLKSISAPGSDKPLFSGVSEERLDASAGLLSKFGQMRDATSKHGPDGSGKDNIDDGASIGSDETLVEWDGAFASLGAKVEANGASNWIENAFNVAVEFIGDALEFLKTAVKSAVKFVVKIASKVVRLYFQIAGKVIMIIVKTATSLVRSVVGFLSNVLGKDLMDLFGLNFGKHVPAIQNKLKEVTLGSFTIFEQILTVNRDSLVGLFDDMEEMIFDSVEKSGAPGGARQETEIEKFVKGILNSPIVKLLLKYNPLQWVTEGISEGIDESMSDFKLPSIKPLAEAVGTTVSGLLDVVLTAFSEVIAVILTSAKDAVMAPDQLLSIAINAIKKTFRTIFHATRDTVLLVVDSIIHLVKFIPVLLTDKWTIPGMTDLWEIWTEQDFSLLNFFTYGAAVVIDLLTKFVPDDKKTKIFGTPFGDGWIDRLGSRPPLATLYEEATRQADIAARYPGPRGPQDKEIIVMMVEVDQKRHPKPRHPKPLHKKDKEEKRKQEEEEDDALEHWLSILSGVSKLATTSVYFFQAANKSPRATGPLAIIKAVVAFTTVGSTMTQAIHVLNKSSSGPGKDEKDIATNWQIAGMVIGCGVGICSAPIDAMMDISSLFGRRGQPSQGDVAERHVGILAGVASNSASGVLTMCVPGTWTKPRGLEIAQTFASAAGAFAIVGGKYLMDKPPVGPIVTVGALNYEFHVTMVSAVLAIRSLSK